MMKEVIDFFLSISRRDYFIYHLHRSILTPDLPSTERDQIPGGANPFNGVNLSSRFYARKILHLKGSDPSWHLINTGLRCIYTDFYSI
jgi:hypothetical protein